MTKELTDYRENLAELDDALRTVNASVRLSMTYLFAMKQAVLRLKNAIDSAENLDDFAARLESALTFLKLFPPTKSLATLAERLVDTARDRSGEFLDELATLDTEINRFVSGLDRMRGELSTIERDLSNDRGDIAAVLPQVDTVLAVLSNPGDLPPPGFDGLIATVETQMAELNTRFPQARIQALVDFATGLAQDLGSIAGSLSVFDGIAEQFADVLSRLDFIDGPLSALVDGLSGLTWVLERVDSLISFVLDPIIDPILEAFGLNALIDALADQIGRLLPDINLLDGLSTLSDDLTRLLGAISDTPEGWALPFVSDLLALIDEVRGASDLEASYLEPILGEGTGGDDILIGETRELLNFLPFDAEGGAGRDVIAGGTGANSINAGAGDDLILASQGADTVDGGPGNGDIYASPRSLATYRFDFAGDTLLLTDLEQTTATPVIHQITNVEYFMFAGSTFHINTLRNALNSLGDGQPVPGTAGPDFFLGTAEVDIFFGNSGNDRFVGFGAVDFIYGEDDIDTVDYLSGGAGSVLAVLDQGHPLWDTGADRLFTIENVIGGVGDDTLVGSPEANVISGGDGDDQIIGLAGDDALNGGRGSDTLAGGAGDDRLYGGSGLDLFLAGRGDDQYHSDATQTRGGIRFDEIAYSTAASDWHDSTPESHPATLFNALGVWDPTLLDMPNFIRLNPLGSAYEVTQVYGDGTFTDLIFGPVSLLATAEDETLNLREGTDVIDAASGDDTVFGFRPDVDAPPQEFASPLVFGSDGNDLLVTYSADEIFVGGAGDDTLRINNAADTDYAPDPDTGPRIRYFIGDGGADFALGADGWAPSNDLYLPVRDGGFDTLDLRGSDFNWILAWQFSTDAQVGRMYAASTNNAFNGRLTEAPLPEDRHDQLYVTGLDHVIGSDRAEVLRGIRTELAYTGNGGDDVVDARFSASALLADMGDGDDLAWSGLGADTLRGGAGADILWANGNITGQREILDGGADNDNIGFIGETSGSGSNLVTRNYAVDGGSGNDILFLRFDAVPLNSAPVVVDLAAGRLGNPDGSGVITGTITGIEMVFSQIDIDATGNAGANVLAAAEGILRGGGGNDLLSIREGTALGGDGNDIVVVNFNGHAEGGAGEDLLRFAGTPSMNLGEDFEVRYTAPLFAWFINIAQGEAIRVENGLSVARSTFTGFESFAAGMGDDTIVADALGRNMSGLNGDDEIYGDVGNDTLHGGRGDDLLDGGAGDDIFTPGGGNDTVQGGLGLDLLDLENRTLSVEIDLEGGRASYVLDDTDPLLVNAPPEQVASTLSFDGIERVILSGQADVVLGSVEADDVAGRAGDDRMAGFGGDDLLDGEQGDDLLRGGQGDDTLFGREGSDTLLGGNGKDLLRGGNQTDYLVGDAGNDTLRGGNGDDTLLGNGDEDRLRGARGSDRLAGGAGDDFIQGGAGEDVLNGGLGDDTLRGGGQTDVFVFSGAFGNDLIRGFQTGPDGDVIDLAGVASIVDFDDLIAEHATNTVGGVVIDDLQGNTIRLSGTELSELSEAAFLF